MASPPLASGAPCGEEITGIHKNTVARGPGAFARNQARISDCHDATIYALAPLDCLSISCCSDCVVVVGAVGKLIRVERCVRLQLIAVCRRIYINASHDCIFYLGTNQPPVLLGDNRFVQVMTALQTHKPSRCYWCGAKLLIRSSRAMVCVLC